MDLAAPLLHEFSYQAMCNDLLAIEDGLRYHYRFTNAAGQDERKEATLSDEDSVWCAIRHMHIAEAIAKLSEDFKHHAGQQGQYAEGSSLNDMRDMLASLPHMQEMKEKLSLHLTMAQNCMNIFERTKLASQANVEQCCATRVTAEGSKPKMLVEEMVTLLDDRNISAQDKVRIIALYIMYSDGVPDEDRRRLFQHARLGLQDMDAVNNLVLLGGRVVKQPATSAWDTWFKKAGARKQPHRENEYELSRYQPLVKLMIEDHCAGKLDQSTYPYVRDAPPDLSGATAGLVSQASSVGNSALARVGISSSSSSAASSSPSRPAPSSLRSAKPTWHQRPRVAAAPSTGPGGAPTGGNAGGSPAMRSAFAQGDDSTRQRFIVFVAGGMTYSEIRAAYQCTPQLGRDCYIGSSHTFTPGSFIECLKMLSQGPPRHGQRPNGHHLHQPHAHIPPAPSGMISPGSSDASSMRSARRFDSPGPGQQAGSYYSTPPERNPNTQSTYDRRFFSPDQQSQPLGSAGSGQSQYFPGAPLSTAGSSGRPSIASTASTTQSGSFAHLQQYDTRSASPAPSDVSKASKDKKRLKVRVRFGVHMEGRQTISDFLRSTLRPHCRCHSSKSRSGCSMGFLLFLHMYLPTP